MHNKLTKNQRENLSIIKKEFKKSDVFVITTNDEILTAERRFNNIQDVIDAVGSFINQFLPYYDGNVVTAHNKIYGCWCLYIDNHHPILCLTNKSPYVKAAFDYLAGNGMGEYVKTKMAS